MSRDRWAEWLLERRHGGDAERRRKQLEFVGMRRDIVLDRAGIQPADTVLDVGCGDGLLGFGALDRVGPDGQVIFSDHPPTCSSAAASWPRNSARPTAASSSRRRCRSCARRPTPRSTWR
jgi:hypothetical protein